MKTSHATTNMAISILAEISAIAMHSTIQMKPYRAAIIHYNARNYYANQISGKQPQTFTANIHTFKSASIFSNRAVSYMCILYGMMYCIILIEYSSTVTILGVTGLF